MSKLREYLIQPAPQGKRWQVVLIATVIVFFVLATIQPFGLSNMGEHKLKLLLGYSFVTAFFTAFVSYVFPLLFTSWYTKNWVLWKSVLNALFIVLFIIIGNSLFLYLYNFGLTWHSTYFYSIVVAHLYFTIPIAFFPGIVIQLLVYNQELKRNLKEAQELNTKLLRKDRQAEVCYSYPEITLSGSTKDSLSLFPEQIIYLEVSGNYVKILYREGEDIKHKLLRTTIKQMEEELLIYPFLVRCHRAFIINVNYILSVKGNSQGYHLVLNSVSEEIPVSRAYTRELRQLLEK